MSSSLITIAGIVGKAAGAAERLFERAKACADGNRQGPAGSLGRSLTRLLAGIVAHAAEPPAVFFSRYSDVWSVAFSQMAPFRRGRDLLPELALTTG